MFLGNYLLPVELVSSSNVLISLFEYEGNYARGDVGITSNKLDVMYP